MVQEARAIALLEKWKSLKWQEYLASPDYKNTESLLTDNRPLVVFPSGNWAQRPKSANQLNGEDDRNLGGGGRLDQEKGLQLYYQNRAKLNTSATQSRTKLFLVSNLGNNHWETCETNPIIGRRTYYRNNGGGDSACGAYTILDIIAGSGLIDTLFTHFQNFMVENSPIATAVFTALRDPAQIKNLPSNTVRKFAAALVSQHVEAQQPRLQSIMKRMITPGEMLTSDDMEVLCESLGIPFCTTEALNIEYEEVRFQKILYGDGDGGLFSSKPLTSTDSRRDFANFCRSEDQDYLQKGGDVSDVYAEDLSVFKNAYEALVLSTLKTRLEYSIELLLTQNLLNAEEIVDGNFIQFKYRGLSYSFAKDSKDLSNFDRSSRKWIALNELFSIETLCDNITEEIKAQQIKNVQTAPQGVTYAAVFPSTEAHAAHDPKVTATHSVVAGVAPLPAVKTTETIYTSVNFAPNTQAPAAPNQRSPHRAATAMHKPAPSEKDRLMALCRDYLTNTTSYRASLISNTPETLEKFSNFVAGVSSHKSNPNPDSSYRGIGVKVDRNFDNNLEITSILSEELRRFTDPTTGSLTPLARGEVITHVYTTISGHKGLYPVSSMSDEAIAIVFHSDGEVQFKTNLRLYSCDNSKNATAIFSPDASNPNAGFTSLKSLQGDNYKFEEAINRSITKGGVAMAATAGPHRPPANLSPTTTVQFAPGANMAETPDEQYR
jgi:hypothetical protein